MNFRGTIGADRVVGGDGADRVFGGPRGAPPSGPGSDVGNDVLIGDPFTNSGGDDVLFGLGGDDLIQGYSGADTAFGGDGNDLLVGARLEGRVYAASYLGQSNPAALLARALFEGREAINRDPVGNLLVGEDGNDGLFSFNAGDILRGGAGVDLAFLNRTVASGDFRLEVRNRGAVASDGTVLSDIETLVVSSFVANNTLRGGDGDDLLRAGADFGAGRQSITGGGGDDYLRASTGDDTLRGGDGDDRIIGDYGADLIAGGNGNDTLQFQGNSRARMTGGAGDDAFTLSYYRFGEGRVYITDFDAAGDDVFLVSDGPRRVFNAEHLLARLSQHGDDVVMRLPHQTILFLHTQLADFGVDDFLR